MSDGFELRTAPAVVFGCGSRKRLGSLVRPLGRRAFLVTGSRSLAQSGVLHELVEVLGEQGVTVVPYAVSGEPDVRVVDEGVRRCAEASCDVVVGVGGGSALDIAKAVAAVVPNGGAAVDYVEGLTTTAPRPFSNAPLPTLAVPTTAGSGSEVTKNAVLRVPEAAVKRSMRSDHMVPRVALIDPDLSRGAPHHVSVPAALDALTHLVEGFVSRGAQPTTDALAIEGVAMSFATLSRVVCGIASPSAAERLALASFWGGVVLANAGLGAVHGLVAPLGGRFAIPHGCGCGAMLASTVRANIAALRRRDPNNPALARYGRIAGLVAGPSASPEQAADAFETLRKGLGAHSLAHYGVTAVELAPIIADSRSGSMKSNPIALSDAELETILTESLGADEPPGGATPRW